MVVQLQDCARLIPKTINLDEARGVFIDDLRKGGGSMTIGATELFRKIWRRKRNLFGQHGWAKNRTTSS